MKKLWLLSVCSAVLVHGEVAGVSLRNEAWPRSTTLAEWTADVMRISGADKAGETAQGKAFFGWLRLFSRMAVGGMIQSYEGAYGQEKYVLDAHKQLFVYGWGFCDTTSRIAEAAWQEYKRDATAGERVITQHADGGYHTMYRLRLNGRYAAFDPRYGYYLLDRDAPDARILDWAELHGKFDTNRTYKHRARPYFEIAGLEWERAKLLQPAYFASESAWRAAGAPIENVFGDGAYKFGTRFHEMGFSLKRGMTVTRHWDNTARKFYVPAGKHTEREFPFLASGRFYRVTEASHGGNWPANDPNYERVKPYLATVPEGAGYPKDLQGGRTIGQAYGVLEYRPDLRDAAYLDGLEAGATLVHAKVSPHLRPKRNEDGGEAVYDIRSPFVLVDGQLTLAVKGETEVAIRTLAPKTREAAEPDVWSAWQTLPMGAREVELGRSRFNGKDVSIHGVYRFQMRVRVNAVAGRRVAAGLDSIGLRLYFENGIMSIPPLFAGKNALRLQVANGSALGAPVTVTFQYETSAGTRTHRQTLRPGDFKKGEAAYAVDVPGLVRSRSVSIAY